jgi:LmbE family N-acetylglucosaminyl deacetylase
MGEPVFADSVFWFMPLAIAVLTGLAAVILRMVRLSRFPGFGGRFDPELGFLNRTPRLVVCGILICFVLVPAVIGISLRLNRVRPTPHRKAISEMTPAPHETGSSVQADDSPTFDSDLTAGESVMGPTVTTSARHPSVRGQVPFDLQRWAYRQTLRIDPGTVRDGTWPQEISRVDVLFVHAHPDDESLDFAVLMAALSRNGMTTATMLLTDGESGLDRFPERPEFPGYPQRRLSGAALRDVRIEEAHRALRVLGADYFIRLGLPNHAYNGTADRLSLNGTLRAWGGEASVVQTVTEVIMALGPRLVVAPDVASEAREHFEHEATGYIVRRAVENTLSDGTGPHAFIVSVDALQKEFYPEAVAVPRAVGSRDLREIQRAALSQHHTQADASVIGIRRLTDLPSEYYLPVFWNLEQSLGELIGADEPIIPAQ